MSKVLLDHPERVLFHVDDKHYAEAILYAVDKHFGYLIVDMSPFEETDLFAPEWVERWHGLIPECCEQGINPGQWSYPEE